MSAVNGANVTDSNGVYVESGMIRAMVRMLVAVGFAAFTVLFIILPSGLFDNFGYTLDSGKVDLAIAIAAALSLFLELALIRWQSSVLEFLAFYKNFSLLAGEQRLGQDRYAGQHRTPLGRPSS
jgi:hypothetical protein